MVIQRVWSQLGFKLWTWLAWFITFNFVNIAWVFFRAKEWDDAIKVLNGMFSLDNFIQFATLFNNILSNDTNIKSFINIETSTVIIFGFILTVLFKNSNELSTKFNNMKNISIPWYLFSVLALGISLIFMSFQTGSEFLYFNF